MFFSACLVLAFQAASPDARLEAARAQLQTCVDAWVADDFTKIADSTHPKLVALLGGRDKIIEKLVELRQEFKAANVAMTSVRIQAPAEIITSGSTLYCSIPAIYRYKNPKRRIRIDRPMLAMSNDDGKTWRFADSSAGEAQLRKIFPDIPQTLKFPPIADPRPDTDPERP